MNWNEEKKSRLAGLLQMGIIALFVFLAVKREAAAIMAGRRRKGKRQ